jgi:hypothetical protein
MNKLLILFNQRQHFKNRLKKRKGTLLYFLFSKVIDTKDNCLIWKYKNHLYFTENNTLQTYINKNI